MPTKSIDELRELVGERFTIVERFPIERGKIAEFAEAIKEDNPIYLDASGETACEAGFDDVPAPLTFTTVASFFRERQDVEGRPDLGFEDKQIVHGEQSFEFERTPVAGDVFSAEGELLDIYQKDGNAGTMTFAEWETTFCDENDEVVVRERSTVIELPDTEDNTDD